MWSDEIAKKVWYHYQQELEHTNSRITNEDEAIPQTYDGFPSLIDLYTAILTVPKIPRSNLKSEKSCSNP